MHTTKVFSALIEAYIDPAVRVIALPGSTRSGKTWSILQLLNIIATRSKHRRLISVVSESFPHLKRGAITDFKNMLDDDEIYDADRWHDTDKKYSYDKGVIEFFSALDASKTLGPARQVLFINEAINVPHSVYQQLAVRTTEKIIIDYNPEWEFWADTVLALRKDVRFIPSTYLDNDMLSAAQIAEIESNKDIDPDWWRVYGLGLQGSRAGLVVKNWDIVADMPPRSEWKQAYIGIDFGWSAPSAVMLLVEAHGEVYIDQLAYGPNMDNLAIADAIKDAGYGSGPGQVEAIADAAEPKSISEIESAGVWINASKNKEIGAGIQIMNRWKKHYTARSLNSIDENRKYRYPEMPDGTRGPVPVKKFGHAKDAERYVFLNRLNNIGVSFAVTSGRASKK